MYGSMVLKIIQQYMLLIEFFFLMYTNFLAPLPFYQKIAVGAMSGKEFQSFANFCLLMLYRVNKCYLRKLVTLLQKHLALQLLST